jgi:hypothetical protein
MMVRNNNITQSRAAHMRVREDADCREGEWMMNGLEDAPNTPSICSIPGRMSVAITGGERMNAAMRSIAICYLSRLSRIVMIIPVGRTEFSTGCVIARQEDPFCRWERRTGCLVSEQSAED